MYIKLFNSIIQNDIDCLKRQTFSRMGGNVTVIVTESVYRDRTIYRPQFIDIRRKNCRHWCVLLPRENYKTRLCSNSHALLDTLYIWANILDLIVKEINCCQRFFCDKQRCSYTGDNHSKANVIGSYLWSLADITISLNCTWSILKAQTYYITTNWLE